MFIVATEVFSLEFKNGTRSATTCISFAAQKHRDQRRKGAEASPYINHPITVATVLAAEAAVVDEVLLIAAVLHDTVEDTKTTFAEPEKHFGGPVVNLVREVTDDKSLPKAERKRLQIESAPVLSAEAKQLKIADKICNIRDITEYPPTDWSFERRREYLDWAERDDIIDCNQKTRTALLKCGHRRGARHGQSGAWNWMRKYNERPRAATTP